MLVTGSCVSVSHVKDMRNRVLEDEILSVQIWIPAEVMREISCVELGLHGECKLWAPEKVLLRPYGHTSWTEFPCDSILSSC